jgi:hypothetical protein
LKHARPEAHLPVVRMLRGTYVGDVPPEEGASGGTCALCLDEDTFELRIERAGPYSIQYGDTVRGSWSADPAEVRLHATEHVSFHEETVRQETPHAVDRHLVLAVHPDAEARLPRLTLRFDLRSPFVTTLRPNVPYVDQDPASLEEVLGLHRGTARATRDYFAALPAVSFFTPLDGSPWSPGDHVRHLTKSLRAITGGLAVPRLLLRAMFGRSDRAPRNFQSLRLSYAEALARGRGAGRFAPRPLPAERLTSAERQRTLEQFVQETDRFDTAVATWTEAEAVRLRLPHPLLGRIPVREMMLFAVLHNVHHAQVVERRRRALW